MESLRFSFLFESKRVTGSDQMLVWKRRESLQPPSLRSPVSAALTLGKVREAILCSVSSGLRAEAYMSTFSLQGGKVKLRRDFSGVQGHTVSLWWGLNHNPNLQISTRIPRTLKSQVWGKNMEASPANSLGVGSPTGDSL